MYLFSTKQLRQSRLTKHLTVLVIQALCTSLLVSSQAHASEPYPKHNARHPISSQPLNSDKSKALRKLIESKSVERVKVMLGEIPAWETFRYEVGLLNEKYSPLHLAAQESEPVVLKALIDSATDINARTSLGNTALHIAVQSRNYPLAVLLVEADASVNALNQAALSPLQIADQLGESRLVNLLKTAGAIVSGTGAFVNSDAIEANISQTQTPLGRYVLFALQPDAQRLATIDAENQLIIYNPATSAIQNHKRLTHTPIHIKYFDQQILIAYEEHLEWLNIETLELERSINLPERPTHLAFYLELPDQTPQASNQKDEESDQRIPSQIFFSSGQNVLSINLYTNEIRTIYETWLVKHLHTSQTQRALVVGTSFDVTFLNLDNYELQGQYQGMYQSATAIGHETVLMEYSTALPSNADNGSQQTDHNTYATQDGVKYVSINNQGVVTRRFTIPRTFQQQNVTLRVFDDKQLLVENFNSVALSMMDGNSFIADFSKHTFSDFDFHPSIGFVLFNSNEIRTVSTTGQVTARFQSFSLPEDQPLGIEVNHPTALSTAKARGKLITVSTPHKKLGSKTRTIENDEPVTALHMSQQYLAAGFRDGSFSIWSLPKLKLIANKPYLSGKVSSILIDEHKNRVFLGGYGRIGVVSWKTDIDQLIRGHNHYITAMALDDERQLFATSSFDDTVRLWDTKAYRLNKTIQLNGGWLNNLSFQANHELVGSGPRLDFKTDTRNLSKQLLNPTPSVTIQKPNTNQIAKFDTHPNGFIANNDGTSINVREIKSNILQTRITAKAGTTNDFAFTSDGNSLVLVSGDQMEYWDPYTGQLQKIVDHGFLKGAFHEIDRIPNSGVMLANNQHGWHQPFLLHENSGERVGQLDYLRQVGDPSDVAQQLSISPQGNYIGIQGVKNFHIFKKQPAGYEKYVSIPRSNPGVTNQYWRNNIGFSANEQYFRYVDFQSPNFSVVYDIESQREVFRSEGKLATFVAENQLLYMSNNTQLSLVNLDTFEQSIVSQQDHNQFISALNYNESQKLVTTADIWGNTITWDGMAKQKLRELRRFDNDIYTADIDESGRFLAYTNQQGIHLLDLRFLEHIELEGTNYPFFGRFDSTKQRFYFRRDAQYHYVDLKTLEIKPSITTQWDSEKTRNGILSKSGNHIAIKTAQQYHIHQLSDGNLLANIDRVGHEGAASILNMKSFDHSKRRLTGHLIKASESSAGSTTLQLGEFDYASSVFQPLHKEISYDLSNEIDSYTSSRDLALNDLSIHHRYYAYSQNYHLKVIDLESQELLFDLYRLDLSHVVFDPSERHLIIADDNGYVEKLDLEKKLITARYQVAKDSIASLKIRGNQLLVLTDSELIHLFDLDSNQPITTIAPRGASDFMIVSPEGYYYATKNAAQFGIAFRRGYDVFPFEQFDLYFNRPDLALANLTQRGVTNKNLTQAYTQAYAKRVTQTASNDMSAIRPELALDRTSIPVNTESHKVTVSYEIKDPAPKSLHVWVNNVPVHGSQGLPVKKRRRSETLRGEISIPLSKGRNRVQMAIRNDAGVESLRETFDVFADQQAETKTHLVVIGASEYQQSERNLNYAAKDAVDFRQLFAGDDVVVHQLTNAQVTRKQVSELKQHLLDTQTNDNVIVFYAGHGMLTDNLEYYLGTFDVNFSQPEERGLSYQTLEYLFDGIPARNRLMLIDACHSGEADRSAQLAAEQQAKNSPLIVNNLTGARGLDFDDSSSTKLDATPKPSVKLGLQNSFNLSKLLFADIRKGTGVTVVSASGSAEFAWEQAELRNGVFTYSLLNGLKNMAADQNQDHQVTVSELQTYVRDQVIELTGGLQQPTFRSENIENDWVVYRAP